MATPNSPLLIFPKADLSLATILPYTQNADGSWTAASSGAFASGAVSLLNYLDSIIPTIEQSLLEAISVNASYMNRIPSIIDAGAVVTENVRRQIGSGSAGASQADPGSVLPLVTAYGMARLQWAYNGVSGHNDVYTMYGLWERFTGGSIQGIGIQKAGMILRLVDTSYTTVSGVAGVPPITIARS